MGLQGRTDGKVAHVRGDRWAAWWRSDQGTVRPDNQDAFVVDADAGVFAVFDGVAGSPNGHEASWAAAEALCNVGPEVPAEAVLDRLNDTVRPTGGATTAVVLFDRGAETLLLSVGDSAAYRMDSEATAERVNPLDRVGRNWLTDNLGSAAMRGHLMPISLQVGESLLLGSDGLVEAVPVEVLGRVLQASDDAVEGALASAFEAVAGAGGLDNATAVLVRRVG